MLEILTNTEMRKADEAAIKDGIPSYTLMQKAAKAVFAAISARVVEIQVKALVLCGPGNNGGDGYCIAQLMQEAGWDVRVLAVADPVTEDARRAREDYKGAYTKDYESSQVVVDALYGTGLMRHIEGKEVALIAALNADHAVEMVCAVDSPSGICGDTGQIMGVAVRADLTVALARKKRGHVLMPGAQYCGEIEVVDIGIADMHIPQTMLKENHPLLWRDAFPFPRAQQHKYLRGHAAVIGGNISHTGAARLAAYGALRVGAGLVSILCDRESLPIYAASCTAVMTKLVLSAEEYASLLADKRITAVAIGPGGGADERTRHQVLTALALHKPLVLDADGLTAFEINPQELFSHIASPCILTPHEGEFERLFAKAGVDMNKDKVSRAQEAAALSKCILLLKGADTIIAAPDGQTVVNTGAPPTLATAGSGDVLTGIIAGLLAAGMPAFKAACAGAWLHARAAEEFGRPGLIAEDLPNMLPAALSQL